MHVYLYDSKICQKKYNSVVAKIETSITDLGLNGKIIRLNVTKSVSSSIETEIINGAKTFIAVGGDKLFSEVINAIAGFSLTKELDIQAPLGFIPIGKSYLASVLGINSNNAIKLLSARRIERLNLGMANSCFFLTYAAISTKNSLIEIDKDYTIEILKKGEIKVVNLADFQELPPNITTNPKDGLLELFIKTKEIKKFFPFMSESQKSVFSFNKLKISNKKSNLMIDNIIEVKPPAEIKIAKRKINLIVGKERSF